MAVEIRILSGARQDERIVFDKTNFRVGSSPECEVYFDPQADTGTVNRSASFQLLEDGWYIAHSTGVILINQREVAGPTRIRAGDVVRMSETGPDFSFGIVSNTAAKQTKSFGQEVPKPFTGSITPPVPPAPVPSAPLLIPAPLAAAPISAEQNTAKAGINERWILWGAGGLAFCMFFTLLICVLALTIYVLLKVNEHGSGGSGDNGSVRTYPPLQPETGESLPPPPTPTFTLTGPTSGTYAQGKPITITWTATNVPDNSTISLFLNTDKTLGNGKEQGIEIKTISAANGDGSYTFDSSGFKPGTYFIGGSMMGKATERKWNSQLTSYITITSTPPPKPEQTTTEGRILAQMKDAVFLIKVEKAGRFWPFATCCAIGKNTLLTSAWVACKISEWRKNPQKGFLIWITNPASGVTMAVKDIYISTLLAILEDKPDDWKYYDVALLTVAEELPKIIPLASNEEIDELKEGLPIYCDGFTHEGEKITEFDSFQPQVMPGKIYLIKAPPDLPSHPILLQIKGKILKNTFGSPIVNDQGKIVAIYGDAMQPQSNAEKYLPEIHYATVLNLEFMNLGLNRKYGKIWTSPNLYGIVSKAKDEK